MPLLWLSTIVAASASVVWLMWAIRWYRRRHPILAALYALAAIGALMMAFGFTLVLAGGDAGVSASLTRRWTWAGAGVPALARLIELIREESRSRYAEALMARVERRADRSDQRFGRVR